VAVSKQSPAKWLVKASVMGDAGAHAILAETIELLSVWLGNIVDLLEPDIVVIGGGVASMLKPFFADMQAGLSRFCVNSRCSEIPVLPACHGEDAGIAGGAALCSRAQLSAQLS
jgi:glucokinase